MAKAENVHVGRVVQIIGPVVDVEFEDNYLPPIYQALRITSEGFDVELLDVRVGRLLDRVDVLDGVAEQLRESTRRVGSAAIRAGAGLVRRLLLRSH